jgi:lambda family phage tail tape measure protein
MATIEDFILRMKVEGQGSVKNVSGTIQNLKDDIADLNQVGGPLGNTINGIIGKLGPLGAVAGLAGGAFVALGAKALQLAGDLSDIAGATGIAAGTLMNFRQSVVEAGGKAEDFAQIAAKLNQSVQEAAGGNETFQKSFQRLGVFVTDANGKVRDTESILRDVIARFRSGQLSSEQYAAAIDVLGKNINKLELAKLQAVADPIKDEQIKQLDKYNENIDKLAETINNKLITAFGGLAAAINNALGAEDRWANTEKEANKRGQTYRDRTEGFMNSPLFGAQREPLSGQLIVQPNRLREMTEKEKAAFKAREEAAAAHANEMQRQINRGANVQTTGAGGFGATPESTLKAREESLKRIKVLEIEQGRQTQLAANNERLSAILNFADQETAITEKTTAAIKDIEINSQAEIAKARLEIFNQERLSNQEKTKEFAAKEKEIQLKAAVDIGKARGQMAEQLNREAERIQNIITQSKARTEEESRLNDLLEQRNKFVNENAAATDRERDRAQALFDLEQERLKIIRQISLIKDLPEAERLAREKEINDIFDQRRQKTVAQQEADKALQGNFSAGFERAYRQYAEDSNNAFETAGRLFQTVTKGMEDNFVDFAKTGKFEFKGFINSILEDLLRSQVRQLISQLFSGGRSGGGSTILNTLGSIFGRANGGPVIGNTPYIVGERGPELFVPNTTGNIMNNASLGGGSVTYNINAVDAMSFKQMVASDPTFLFAVTEQGRRRLPGARA